MEGSAPSAQQTLNDVKSVAVIGAGVSGILATRYLREAGLDVTVFERNRQAGGIWIYQDRKSPEPACPANKPLETAWDLCPWYDLSRTRELPDIIDARSHGEWLTRHAPPGPCYDGLTNNFSVLAMEIKDHSWPWEIPEVTPERPDHASEWTSHRRILQHLTNAASRFGLEDCVHYRTLVERVYNNGGKWVVKTSTLATTGDDRERYRIQRRDWEFDAVVVACGHYNTPRLPDIPGLQAWRTQFPNRVHHSQSYRRPQTYADQNVLLVGGGTSSTEIARELGPVVRKMYQSGRGSVFDLPVEFLPDNCERVGQIAIFNTIVEPEASARGTVDDAELRPISSSVLMADGTVLYDIHQVIVCTGYHYAYPFMPYLHADDLEVDTKALVTDGTCTLNLDRDMFYIPDPTLCFVGISLFIATFSFFEYQAMAIAAVLSGKASLPNQAEIQHRYAQRLARRGPTKFMNARMDEEVTYVEQLVKWLNEEDPARNVRGFSQQWHAVRDAGKLAKIRARFAREKAEREFQDQL